MSPPHSKSKRNAGASLVAVLWLIGVLGLSILGVAKFVALDTQWATNVRKNAEARNFAENGIAIASHPRVKIGDPLLTSLDEETGSGYDVQITWEEGLIPLNRVLILGRKDILRRLFQAWGQHPDSAAALADALTDWIDEDDLISLNGAEADTYSQAGKTGFPYNRPFETLSEVEWVMGMEEISILKPDWKKYFTIWSNGQIDLNEANPEIVYAVVGGSDLFLAEEFVAQRNGEDRIAGTPDDRKFASVSSALGFFGSEVDPNNNLISVRSTTKRIYSTGYFRGFETAISETRRSNLLLWRIEH
jgi:type II secretory pathway component PulK